MPIRRFGSAKPGAGGQKLPFARAVEAGGFLFVSGQVGMDKNGEIVPGGIIPQTEQTIANLLAILAEAGYGLEDVVRIGVWLDDPRDFWTFNRIYAKTFSEHAPARACVESRLMVDGKIEMDLTAYRDPS